MHAPGDRRRASKRFYPETAMRICTALAASAFIAALAADAATLRADGRVRAAYLGE